MLFKTPYRVKDARVFNIFWPTQWYIEFDNTRVLQGLTRSEAHEMCNALNTAYNMGLNHVEPLT